MTCPLCPPRLRRPCRCATVRAIADLLRSVPPADRELVIDDARQIVRQSPPPRPHVRRPQHVRVSP